MQAYHESYIFDRVVEVYQHDRYSLTMALDNLTMTKPHRKNKLGNTLQPGLKPHLPAHTNRMKSNPQQQSSHQTSQQPSLPLTATMTGSAGSNIRTEPANASGTKVLPLKTF